MKRKTIKADSPEEIDKLTNEFDDKCPTKFTNPMTLWTPNGIKYIYVLYYEV